MKNVLLGVTGSVAATVTNKLAGVKNSLMLKKTLISGYTDF